MKFDINDNLTIVCEYYENRYNWGHRCKIFINNIEVDKKKIVYYNRTWEAHTFDSLLQKCCDSKSLTKNDKDDIKNYIKNRGL